MQRIYIKKQSEKYKKLQKKSNEFQRIQKNVKKTRIQRNHSIKKKTRETKRNPTKSKEFTKSNRIQNEIEIILKNSKEFQKNL